MHDMQLFNTPSSFDFISMLHLSCKWKWEKIIYLYISLQQLQNWFCFFGRSFTWGLFWLLDLNLHGAVYTNHSICKSLSVTTLMPTAEWQWCLRPSKYQQLLNWQRNIDWGMLKQWYRVWTVVWHLGWVVILNHCHMHIHIHHKQHMWYKHLHINAC